MRAATAKLVARMTSSVALRLKVALLMACCAAAVCASDCSAMLTTVALKRRAYRAGLARSLQLRNRRRALRLAVAAGAVPLFRRGTGVLTDYQSLLAGGDLASETDPSRAEYFRHVKEKFRCAFRLSIEEYRWVMDDAGVREDLENRMPGRIAEHATTIHIWSSDEVALVALWFLASGATYREVSEVFRMGCSEAQVMRFVRVFTRAVNSRCHHRMIKFPRSEEERRKTALQFHEWSGMAGVLGCIDGSHIWITPTKADTAIYANRKQYMPIILSAVVDGMGRFIDINIGMPGLGSRFVVCFAIIKKRNRTHAMAHAIELSIRPKTMANHNCHLPRLSHPPCAFSHFRLFLRTPEGRRSDVRALKKSPLWERCERDEAGSCWVPHPYVLLGDSAYPLKRWMQKGFPDEMCYTNERIGDYNEAFSGTRVIVECAFGKLKGQWRCVQHIRQRRKEDWAETVQCCCILHNATINIGGKGWPNGPNKSRFGSGTEESEIYDQALDDLGAPIGTGGHGWGGDEAALETWARLFDEACWPENYDDNGSRRPGWRGRRRPLR